MTSTHNPLHGRRANRPSWSHARNIALVGLAAASLALTTSCSTDAVGDTDANLYVTTTLDDVEGTGRQLVQRFVDIVTSENPQPLLEEFLSPAFLLARANGDIYDKASYVQTPAVVDTVTILDDGFRSLQDGAVLSVYFKMNVDEVIDGAPTKATEVFRLASFVHTVDGWRLLTWSHFDPIGS